MKDTAPKKIAVYSRKSRFTGKGDSLTFCALGQDTALYVLADGLRVHRGSSLFELLPVIRRFWIVYNNINRLAPLSLIAV